jgi:hypothetical protein
MGRARRLWVLPRHEKLCFIEALILLVLSSVSVKTIAFRHIHRALRARSDGPNEYAPKRLKRRINDVRLVNISISRAASALPWECLCLSRSIAAYLMFRRRGIPATLVAGVKSQGHFLLAHAWVQTSNIAPDGEFENGAFTPLIRIGRRS